MLRRALLQFILAGFCIVRCLPQQGSPTALTNPSQIILPSDYSIDRRYPVLIFLPFTGGSATDLMNMYCSALGDYSITNLPIERRFESLLKSMFGGSASEKSFVLVLPPGKGSTADQSWKGFLACIERYEQRIKEDLQTLLRNSSIDTNRIVLAGYSLGGDLSWALSIRNPSLFQGAIVMGSRCGYFEKNRLPMLTKKGFKYFLAMGAHETEHRLRGIKHSMTLLDRAKTDYRYVVIQDNEHAPAPLSILAEAASWILFDN